MTRKELINKALRGIGMRVIKGSESKADPLMPYFLADVMFQVYMKDVSPVKLKGRLKYMQTVFRKRFNRFILPLYYYLEKTEFQEMTDLMDEVGDYLSNEIMMLRSRTMLMLECIPNFEDKKVATSLLMCHMLAQYAESAYENVYINTKEYDWGIVEDKRTNSDLIFFREWFYKMTMLYIASVPGGEFTMRDVEMQPTFSLIAKRIYNWLKQN